MAEKEMAKARAKVAKAMGKVRVKAEKAKAVSKAIRTTIMGTRAKETKTAMTRAKGIQREIRTKDRTVGTKFWA